MAVPEAAAARRLAVPASRPGAATTTLARGIDASWRDYLTLTKPRIMSLLLLTAVCAMVAASGGDPAAGPLVALAVGGALACGGASALNHVLDRDIDQLMGPRTASRPVAAGRISTGRATAFGLALSVIAFAILAVWTNLLAAGLAVAGGSFYVVVYTVWLKRTTTQNIVIGGAAGAIPVLSGWAAGSGRLGVGALWLFAIVLVWTPPHFWALALLLERHYAAAEVPMLPVVRGPGTASRHVLLYTIGLVPVTLAPGLLGTFGPVYTGAAALLGAVFVVLAARLVHARSAARAALVFHFSLLYLALLFLALAADAAVR